MCKLSDRYIRIIGVYIMYKLFIGNKQEVTDNDHDPLTPLLIISYLL